jgi:sugar phosphate isomerase/epimerase
MGTPHHQVKEAIELFTSLGFGGIEIICRDDYKCGVSPDTTEKEAKKLLEFASSHNMKFACLTPYITELNSPDSQKREKEKEEMKKCIRLARYLDCKVVRAYGGSYFPREGLEKYEKRKKIFIHSMQELGKYAQDLNVCLAIENHFNTLTYDAKHSLKVVSEINIPGVGILYDQANLGLIGAEEYREAINMQAPYIVHVHVKDFAYKGEERTFRSSSVTGIKESERIVRFKVTGEGIVPWPAIIRLLKKIGYKGFLSLEYTYWKNPKDLPPPEIGMKKEGDFLKALLAS